MFKPFAFFIVTILEQIKMNQYLYDFLILIRLYITIPFSKLQNSINQFKTAMQTDIIGRRANHQIKFTSFRLIIKIFVVKT